MGSLSRALLVILLIVLVSARPAPVDSKAGEPKYLGKEDELKPKMREQIASLREQIKKETERYAEMVKDDKVDSIEKIGLLGHIVQLSLHHYESLNGGDFPFTLDCVLYHSGLFTNETVPLNPFTLKAVENAKFSSPTKGDLIYVPYLSREGVEGYWLIILGDREYPETREDTPQEVGNGIPIPKNTYLVLSAYPEGF